MAGKFEGTEKRKKWPWILAICLLLIAAAVLYYFYFYQGNSGTPTLIVETPQKLSASQTEDFTLDVTVSALGEARYPAMSMVSLLIPLGWNFSVWRKVTFSS